MDTGNLVSCAVVAPYGIAGRDNDIVGIATDLRQNFAFFEILIILPLIYQDTLSDTLRRELIAAAPQTRVIILDAPPHFEDIAVDAYKAALGDVVVVIDADELGARPILDLVNPILNGNRLVRLKRERSSGLGVLSSFLVKLVTGYEVDTSFCRTMALGRTLLSELLPSTERLVLFRFMLGRSPSGSVVLDTPIRQMNMGFGGIGRRADLVARLVTTATPRLLRQAAMLCGLLSFASVIAVVYVLLNLLFNPSVVEGWATTNTLIALLMVVQMGAMAAVCLGLSRMLDDSTRAATTRRVDEWAAGDLFGRTNLLNVETKNLTGSATKFSAHRIDLGAGSLDYDT